MDHRDFYGSSLLGNLPTSWTGYRDNSGDHEYNFVGISADSVEAAIPTIAACTSPPPPMVSLSNLSDDQFSQILDNNKRTCYKQPIDEFQLYNLSDSDEDDHNDDIKATPTSPVPPRYNPLVKEPSVVHYTVPQTMDEILSAFKNCCDDIDDDRVNVDMPTFGTPSLSRLAAKMGLTVSFHTYFSMSKKTYKSTAMAGLDQCMCVFGWVVWAGLPEAYM